uniref:Uncharacterized protein n=1 Tax=Arundo donax TaxID=35708 RepID=A0A0A9EFU9_ARUDO
MIQSTARHMHLATHTSKPTNKTA